MKSLLLLSLMTLAALQGICRAPNTGSISLNVTNSLFISYNNIDELLTPKISDNSLELRVKTGASAYAVYAQVNFMDPFQNNSFAGKLSLRLRSNTSYNANIKTPQVPLSNTPVLLFTQPATGNPEEFQFFYDLVVGPFDSFVPTGVSNYTINITMTAP